MSNNLTHLSTGVETNKFNLASNKVMFQMLTSDVYSRPKEAVMREWSTNACDVCIGAGKEVQYDVHLPTTEEPVLFVRDYGTGLHPDDIVGLFSTIGDSTKRDSDDQNGCLGIGRMAGLSVADAFTIESYFKGTQYNFAVSMDQGTPIMMNFGSFPTDEPDGLKLGVTVPCEDIPIYKEIAEKIYPYFDYKPNLNYDLDIASKAKLFRDTDWYIEKVGLGAPRSAKCKVVLSQVAYSIPESSDINKRGLQSVIIKAPPNSVSFNPGRESLSLDRKTVKFLNESFRVIEENVIEQTDKALSLCTSDKETVEAFFSIKRSCPFIIKNMTLLKNNVSSYLNDFIPQVSNSVLPCNPIKHPNVSLNLKPSYGTNARLVEDHHVGIDDFFSCKHIVVDVKTGFSSTLRSCFSNKDKHFLWKRTKGADLETTVEQIKTLLNTMGIEYTLVSSIMEDTERKEPNNYETISNKVLRASPISLSSFRPCAAKTFTNEEKVEGIYLYLKLNNTSPILNTTEENTQTLFSRYMTLYREVSEYKKLPKIYGVAKKYQSHVDNLPNWIDFEEFMKAEIKTCKFYTYPETDIISRRTLHSISHLINSSVPEDIQTLATCMNDFLVNTRTSSSKVLLNETTIGKLNDLGVELVPYKLGYDSLVADVKGKYPITIQTLEGRSLFRGSIPKSVTDLIHLEHNYYELLNSE